jgi:hypothetical protein
MVARAKRDGMPAWAARVLAECRPPSDWHEWQQYCAWQDGRLAVPGLPDPDSPEGQRLLASLKVSLR